METLEDYRHGRGAQLNPHNKFLKNAFVTEHIEGIDEEGEFRNKNTKFIFIRHLQSR